MKLPSDQKFFVFDIESVGLHGQAFAVAGGVYDINGEKAGKEFAMHCECFSEMGVEGRSAEDVEWCKANVSIAADSYLCTTPSQMRWMFWKIWEAAKVEFPGILMSVECGWPVEARFLIGCIDQDPLVRNWQGPYPMHEIATLMLAAGMDPMATYERRENELPAHEPLADARLSARLLAQAIQTIQSFEQPGMTGDDFMAMAVVGQKLGMTGLLRIGDVFRKVLEKL